MIKPLQMNTMDCLWTYYHLENVDIQVLMAIGVWDIWNYSIFHSEFGGHSVLNTSQYNKKMLFALALICGIYRTYLDNQIACNRDLHHVDTIVFDGWLTIPLKVNLLPSS